MIILNNFDTNDLSNLQSHSTAKCSHKTHNQLPGRKKERERKR